MPTASILMCPPTYFSVDYVINPWMEGNVSAADPVAVERQWQALRAALAEQARIVTVTPAPGLPDMAFTANAGLVHDALFVPSRFRHVEREGEAALFTAWAREAGFDIKELPPGLHFEGAGDALFERGAERLWVGLGPRTDAGVVEWLTGLLGIEVLPLRLIDAHFYHLDTCFCPLDDGHLLYHPAAFDRESQARIARHIPDSHRIAVPGQDAARFACNAVNIGRTVVLHQASPALETMLAEAGFNTVQTPLDEFLKAGGSAKCLTLRLDEPPLA